MQQAHGEVNRLNQAIEQKDKEIHQLKERDQSAQDELKFRAQKIKAHEEMITNLQQDNNKYRRQLQELE